MNLNRNGRARAPEPPDARKSPRHSNSTQAVLPPARLAAHETTQEHYAIAARAQNTDARHRRAKYRRAPSPRATARAGAGRPQAVNDALKSSKHRPTALEKLSYHAELGERLGSMAEDGDVTPSPVLRAVRCGQEDEECAVFIEKSFMRGAGAEKQRLEHIARFKAPTNKAREVTTQRPNCHIEMNPSDAGNNDRFVVQEGDCKEIAPKVRYVSSPRRARRRRAPLLKVILTGRGGPAVHDKRRPVSGGPCGEVFERLAALVMICTNPCPRSSIPSGRAVWAFASRRRVLRCRQVLLARRVVDDEREVPDAIGQG